MATVCVRRLCCTRNVTTVRTLWFARTLTSKSSTFALSRFALCHHTRYLKSAVQPTSIIFRSYCDSKEKQESTPKTEEKLSLYKRFKQMYRNYWYVLLPVHIVTSVGWFGGFYYMAKSGVDIVGILESWNASERIINSLKDSSMGYVAISYAMYKIATPVRYTVTLGGTTIAINYLKSWGYIKPVPSTEKLKEIYKERKENMKENIMETMKETKELYHEQKENIMETMRGKKDDIKICKDALKERKDELLKKCANQHKDILKKEKNRSV